VFEQQQRGKENEKMKKGNKFFFFFSSFLPLFLLQFSVEHLLDFLYCEPRNPILQKKKEDPPSARIFIEKERER